MKKYKVFFKDIVIGLLVINEEGKYSYTVFEEGLNEAKKKGPIFFQLEKSTDGFVDSIPVLYNRIENCKRFNEIENIKYPTDDIRIELIKG